MNHSFAASRRQFIAAAAAGSAAPALWLPTRVHAAESVIVENANGRLRGLRAAGAKAQLGQAPVYPEEFAWRSPANGFASHGIDVPFALDTFASDRRTTNVGPVAAKVSPAAMSAFADSGKPDGPEIPQWFPYDVTRRATMAIDERPRLVDDFRGTDRRVSDMLPLQHAFDLREGPLLQTP